MDTRNLVTKIDEHGNDRLALAQEVIVSAGNILVAAGFQRDEIAGFFRQAADQLGSTAGPENSANPPCGDHPVQPAREIRPAGSVAEMLTRFAEIAPVRALADIAVGPQLVAGLRDGPEPARPHIDLALKMLPQVAEAQGWLRDTAREAGFEVVTSRQQWLAEAAPEALARVGHMVFLDDFEAACKPCFDFLAALVAAVVRENDEQALNVLLHGLVSCGIIITYGLKIELETAVEKLIPRRIDAV
jgi:hypothetical protein